MKVSSLIFIALAIHCLLTLGIVSASPLAPPYPPSDLIRSVTWHWDSYKTAALGSELWPVTWGPDDHLYAAWGDGGGFGGSDSDGRVSMGFGRIEGPPEHFRGINVNGGKNHEHPASFSEKGKTASLVFVEGVKSRGRVRLQKGSPTALPAASGQAVPVNVTSHKRLVLFALRRVCSLHPARSNAAPPLPPAASGQADSSQLTKPRRSPHRVGQR